MHDVHAVLSQQPYAMDTDRDPRYAHPSGPTGQQIQHPSAYRQPQHHPNKGGAPRPGMGGHGAAAVSALKGHQEHWLETKAIRRHTNDRSAVAPTLMKYRGALTWPRSNDPLPADIAEAVAWKDLRDRCMSCNVTSKPFILAAKIGIPFLLISSLCFFLWTLRQFDQENAAEEEEPSVAGDIIPAPSGRMLLRRPFFTQSGGGDGVRSASLSDIQDSPLLIAGAAVLFGTFLILVGPGIALLNVLHQQTRFEQTVSALHFLYACDTLHGQVDAPGGGEVFHEVRFRQRKCCNCKARVRMYTVYRNGEVEWWEDHEWVGSRRFDDGTVV